LTIASLFVPLPPLGRRMRSVLNLLHAPAFALLAVIAATLVQRVSRGRRTLALAGIWAALSVLGIVIESLQGFFGRNPSWADAGANALGAGAGLLFWSAPRVDARLTRAAMSITGLLLVAVASIDPLSDILDEVEQQHALPLVASFENARELSRWEHTPAARIALSSEYTTHGSGSLRVTFGTEQYSGVTMVWPPRDWRPYRRLRLDVTLAGKSPLDLVIKIYDREHRRRGFPDDDRFHQRVRLRPGSQTIAVDLDKVRHAPAKRTMDLAHIDAIELFVVAPKQPRTIFLDDVRFEGGSG
jgi:hypothetical protein